MIKKEEQVEESVEDFDLDDEEGAGDEDSDEDNSEDSDDLDDEEDNDEEYEYEEEEDESDEEEFFKQNPLKAMWIKLKEVEEKLNSIEEALMQEELEEDG